MLSTSKQVKKSSNFEDHSNPLSPLHPRFDLESNLKVSISRNVNQFYEWQAEAILKVLRTRKSLVYSAPTSAGKSLVSETLMLQNILTSGRKAIYIVPYVSIVIEKTISLEKLASDLDLKIGAFYGPFANPNFKDVDLAICTIEKANGLINQLIKEGNLVELVCCICVDELHMSGEKERGYLLELTLSKIIFIASDVIQILGMSATIPNIEILSSWLKAELYQTTHRPIPLLEFIKMGNQLFDSNNKIIRNLAFDPKEAARIGDPEGLVCLVFEVLSKGLSCLVFCATKRECENACTLVAKLLIKDQNLPIELLEARQKLLIDLNNTPSGLDKTLKLSIVHGIAFHHSGLTIEERSLLEVAFRNGIISCLIATSTLASGVNLPARRGRSLIFRTPFMGRNFLSSSEYKQMKGRAGRKGLDEVGESILICKKEDFQRCLELMKKEPLSVESCLFYHQIGLARAILEAISTGVLQKKDQIPIYISNTLLAYHPLFQTDQAEQRLAEAINFLKENNFLLIETDETLVPTVLSHATLASSLSPDDALLVASELNRDMNSFCIRDDFHIIYHTTPINFNYIQHDWQRIFDKVNSMLQTSGKKIVADLIGIQPFYLQKIAMGASLSRIDSKFLIHQRYANALILFDLTIDGLTFQDIVSSYGISKGGLQQLQQLAASFYGQICSFSKIANLKLMESLLYRVRDKMGLEAEITHLMKLRNVDLSLARCLSSSGIKSVYDLAISEEEPLQNIISTNYPRLTDMDVLKISRQIQIQARTHMDSTS